MWRGVQSPENSAAHDVTIVPLLNDIDLCVSRIGPLLGCDGDRMDRDCAWTTSLMRVPFYSGVAKWPCLPNATTL